MVLYFLRRLITSFINKLPLSFIHYFFFSKIWVLRITFNHLRLFFDILALRVNDTLFLSFTCFVVKLLTEVLWAKSALAIENSDFFSNILLNKVLRPVIRFFSGIKKFIFKLFQFFLPFLLLHRILLRPFRLLFDIVFKFQSQFLLLRHSFPLANNLIDQIRVVEPGELFLIFFKKSLVEHGVVVPEKCLFWELFDKFIDYLLRLAKLSQISHDKSCFSFSFLDVFVCVSKHLFYEVDIRIKLFIRANLPFA